MECFSRTLAEHLFGAQYTQELLLAARSSKAQSSEWVHALPEVVAAINDEPAWLTGKKPSESDAIKATSVKQKSSLPGYRS